MEEFEEDTISRLHLHFLFWSPIAMSEHTDHGPQFPFGSMLAQLFWTKLQLFIVRMLIHFFIYRIIIKMRQISVRSIKFLPDDPPQLICTVHVVPLRRFDQAESVDVTDVGLALRSQEIESAHILLECFLNLSSNFFLLWRQVYWVAYFFATGVSQYHTIQCWAFTCFGMGIFAADSIDLYIESICW